MLTALPMRPEELTPAVDLARAVGALLHADPERISLLVSSLRGAERSIESTVQGMSMRGCLAPGARIRIELETNSRYTCGTVIAFLVGEQLVVHRVVHRGRFGPAAGQFLTRGDAPIVPDAPVAYARILGRVSGVFAEGRWVAPGPVAPRSWRARLLSAGVLWVATVLLYLRPGLAATLLAGLHHLEGVARQARSRRYLRRSPAPRRSP